MTEYVELELPHPPITIPRVVLWMEQEGNCVSLMSKYVDETGNEYPHKFEAVFIVIPDGTVKKRWGLESEPNFIACDSDWKPISTSRVVDYENRR